METLSCLWVARTSNDGQSDAIFSFLTSTRPGRKMGRSRATNVIIANAMINTYTITLAIFQIVTMMSLYL